MAVCSKCDGARELPCDSCKGAKRTKGFLGIGAKACAACQGKGTVPCKDCEDEDEVESGLPPAVVPTSTPSVASQPPRRGGRDTVAANVSAFDPSWLNAQSTGPSVPPPGSTPRGAGGPSSDPMRPSGGAIPSASPPVGARPHSASMRAVADGGEIASVPPPSQHLASLPSSRPSGAPTARRHPLSGTLPLEDAAPTKPPKGPGKSGTLPLNAKIPDFLRDGSIPPYPSSSGPPKDASDSTVVGALTGQISATLSAPPSGPVTTREDFLRFVGHGTIAGAEVVGADLSEAPLARANLARVSFTHVDLAGAELTEARLAGVRVDRVILSPRLHAALLSAKVDLSHASYTRRAWGEGAAQRVWAPLLRQAPLPTGVPQADTLMAKVSALVDWCNGALASRVRPLVLAGMRMSEGGAGAKAHFWKVARGVLDVAEGAIAALASTAKQDPAHGPIDAAAERLVAELRSLVEAFPSPLPAAAPEDDTGELEAPAESVIVSLAAVDDTLTDLADRLERERILANTDIGSGSASPWTGANTAALSARELFWAGVAPASSLDADLVAEKARALRIAIQSETESRPDEGDSVRAYCTQMLETARAMIRHHRGQEPESRGDVALLRAAHPELISWHPAALARAYDRVVAAANGSLAG